MIGGEGGGLRRGADAIEQIIYAYEDEITGDDVVCSLDFWSKQAQG